MTNKEAIEFIKNMIDREAIGFVVPEGDGDVAIWQYHIEALEMAITALQELDENLAKLGNSTDEVNNPTNNSNNSIKNCVKGLTACRVPEDDTPTNTPTGTTNTPTDCISRQAVIKLIKYSNYNLSYFDETYVLIGDVERLPSVQPEEDCDGCKYENADDGVLVPCGMCKRNHDDMYERRTDEA